MDFYSVGKLPNPTKFLMSEFYKMRGHFVIAGLPIKL